MADQRHVDEYSGIETTGHEWDGIRELDNPHFVFVIHSSNYQPTAFQYPPVPGV